MPYKIVMVRNDPNYGKRRHKGLAAVHVLRSYLERHSALASELQVEIVELNSCWPQATELDTRWILSFEPDAVGLSCYCWNIGMQAGIASMLRRARPGIAIIAGGPEVSFDAEAFMAANPAVDYVVRGEGEVTFTELVDHLVSGKGRPAAIRSLNWRNGGTTCANPDRPLIEDLDTIPSPILDQRVDLFATDGEVMIETVRGCVYHCSFCLHNKGQTGMRVFSWPRVEAEVRALCEHPAVNVIWFADPTFDYDEARALRILRLIEEANAGQGVAFELRAEMLTPALIAQLARLNVVDVGIGLQSINPIALSNVRRASNLESFRRNVSMLAEALKDVGTRIDLDVIYGLPGDCYAGYMDTIDFALDLGGHVYYQPLRLLKGTNLAQRAETFGLEAAPSPPHNLERSLTFPHEDMIRAHHLNAGLDFLQCESMVVQEAIRELRDMARQASQKCSMATACEIVGRGLWASEARNLFRVANASPDDIPVHWRISELATLLTGGRLDNILPIGPRHDLATRLRASMSLSDGCAPSSSGYFHAAL
ncbi:MAG: B12-binding domain-containing radical SAM protein [Solidesulfovibrio sp. DCME]|uniref:B12-binding domain-containing radical SAM protein n=1 Tax=Solidesulfovibrio sp. DCME TaxID=3447380 RepID=UPI003D0ADA6E